MLRRGSHLVFVSVVLAIPGFAEPPATNDMGLLPGDNSVVLATNSQFEHSVALGDGSYLVAWTDYRGRSAGSQSIQGDGDVFGIRLDADANPIDRVPFLIAGGMGLQQRPLVAWNGSAWLVAYTSQDLVGGYFEDRLRAVRVSPQGQVLDETPIEFPPTQFQPNTVGLQLAGQAGQWMLTRCIYHDTGYGTFLAGQRISGAGQLIDAQPVMLIDWVYGSTRTVVAGGAYLVAGPDWSDSSVIKARRIGLDGQPIGESFTIPSLNIASNGTEYYVVWIANYVNLVGSRMTSGGTLMTPSGTMIVPNFSQYSHSTLTHDGVYWWLEWGVSDVLRTVRIDASGSVVDPNGGVLLPISIGGNINTAYSPALAPRPGGGVHVFWYDVRVGLGYDTNVFTLPVTVQNVAGAERGVSTSTSNQRNADLALGVNDATAVIVVSEAANDDRVLVYFVDSWGHVATPEPVEVYRGPTVGKAAIAFNGAVYIAVFDAGASGATPTKIMARRFRAGGEFVDAQPFDVMPGFNPDVEALGDNFLVAGTRYGTYPQNIFLVGNRIDGATGTLIDGPSGIFLGGFYVNGIPRVRSDGLKWFVAAHSMWSHNASQGDAILCIVPAVGAPSPAFNPTPFSGGTGDLDIAYSGDVYLLVWRMNSLSNANNYVAGRIMHADGTLPPGFLTIAEAPGRQLRPTVSWDGSTFVVVWEDQRNQGTFFDARTDVYGARVTEDGILQDPLAFAVPAGSDADAAPAIMSRADGASLIASTRWTLSSEHDSYRVGLSLLGQIMVQGDTDADGDIDLTDFAQWLQCESQTGAALPTECSNSDMDADGDVDFHDFARFQLAFTGPS